MEVQNRNIKIAIKTFLIDGVCTCGVDDIHSKDHCPYADLYEQNPVCTIYEGQLKPTVEGYLTRLPACINDEGERWKALKERNP